MSKVLLFAAPIEMTPAIAGGIPEGWSAACVGVGPISSAAGTAEFVAREAPSELMFLGTCGAYPKSGLEVGQIVSVSAVTISSGDLVAGRSRLPDLEKQVHKGLQTFPGIPSVVAVCTLGVTESGELASQLELHGTVEHLELFSVCSAAKMPVSALLVVSNVVGPEGGLEWQAHHRDCMEKLGEYVRQHVQ